MKGEVNAVASETQSFLASRHRTYQASGKSDELVQCEENGKREALQLVLRAGSRMKPLEPLTGSLLRDQPGSV
jgi:hypothetical protein